MSISFFLFQITMLEFFKANSHKMRSFGNLSSSNYYFCHLEVPDWAIECYKRVGLLIFGSGVCELTTDIAKYSIGRLRPHFFAVSFRIFLYIVYFKSQKILSIEIYICLFVLCFFLFPRSANQFYPMAPPVRIPWTKAAILKTSPAVVWIIPPKLSRNRICHFPVAMPVLLHLRWSIQR